MYLFVFIAVVACVLGIAVENYRWPQDRSAAQQRFLAAESSSEKLTLLVGLVLNHSVVRWLIAFATASTVVLGLLTVPSLQGVIRRAIDAGTISATGLYIAVGLTVSVLMALLSVAARRIAT